jgi:hypothetical protein
MDDRQVDEVEVNRMVPRPRVLVERLGGCNACVRSQRGRCKHAILVLTATMKPAERIALPVFRQRLQLSQPSLSQTPAQQPTQFPQYRLLRFDTDLLLVGKCRVAIPQAVRA